MYVGSEEAIRGIWIWQRRRVMIKRDPQKKIEREGESLKTAKSFKRRNSKWSWKCLPLPLFCRNQDKFGLIIRRMLYSFFLGYLHFKSVRRVPSWCQIPAQAAADAWDSEITYECRSIRTGETLQRKDNFVLSLSLSKIFKSICCFWRDKKYHFHFLFFCRSTKSQIR